MWIPSGHTVTSPAAHSEMSQSCVPAMPTVGHSTTQVDPSLHVVWQGPPAHAKSHVEPGPQLHVPFAHVPLQMSFLRQSTWQGGVAHVKSQVAFWLQVHWPLAHAPLQSAASPQFTWQGGASQVNSQVSPAGQTHSPLEQSAVTPHDGVKVMSARPTRSADAVTAAADFMCRNVANAPSERPTSIRSASGAKGEPSRRLSAEPGARDQSTKRSVSM